MDLTQLYTKQPIPTPANVVSRANLRHRLRDESTPKCWYKYLKRWSTIVKIGSDCTYVAVSKDNLPWNT